MFRNNMGGSGEWDSRMMDSLNNFDLSSPEVKQQFGEFIQRHSLFLFLEIFTYTGQTLRSVH